MSLFFVGQRVRVVYTDEPQLAYLIGAEGRIISPCNVYSGSWDVDVNGNRSRTHGGLPYSFRPHHLSPILPEGHQPAELTVDELLPFLKVREAA